MAEYDNPDAVELASAYLDGEATADERARVEEDPALLAEVERLRRVREAVATTSPAPPAQRDAAITAALSAFDELRARDPSAPTIVPISSRRHARWMQGVTAVAAAALLVVGGFVIANRGDDDGSADEVLQAEPTITAEREAADAPLVAPPTEQAAAAESVEELAPAAVAPTTAAATTTLATTELAMDAAAAAPAAASESPVLQDADQLRSFAESLDVAPPPLTDVLADCESGRLPSTPDAMIEDADSNLSEVVVASTEGGYAAVSLDDCTIVIRTSTAADEAEG
jgi:hypothetical protein